MASMAQIYPLHILIASLAGLMNRQQGEVLDEVRHRSLLLAVHPARYRQE